MPTVELSHDEFARRTLYRESITAPSHYASTGRAYVCQYCGGHKRTMYNYYYRNDDRLSPITRREVTGPFCNIECYRAYSA